MKDSLIVLGFFVGGCLLGALGYLPVDLKTGNMSIYILYALMFQIGISIGSNKELKSMISQLAPAGNPSSPQIYQPTVAPCPIVIRA